MKNGSRTVPPISYLLAFLLLVAAAPGRSVERFVHTYDLTIADATRTSSIGVILDAPFNGDFPPPRSAGGISIAAWERNDPAAQYKELLHADLGLPGGLFQGVRGNLGVTVLVGKSASDRLDVQQLHGEQVEHWRKTSPLELAKSGMVSMGGRNYSFLEGGRQESETFIAHYSLALARNYYLEFVFDFVTKDSARNPVYSVRAHALIEQIMQSVSVRTTGNEP